MYLYASVVALLPYSIYLSYYITIQTHKHKFSTVVLYPIPMHKSLFWTLVRKKIKHVVFEPQLSACHTKYKNSSKTKQNVDTYRTSSSTHHQPIIDHLFHSIEYPARSMKLLLHIPTRVYRFQVV